MGPLPEVATLQSRGTSLGSEVAELKNKLKVQQDAAALFQRERDHIRGELRQQQRVSKHMQMKDIKDKNELVHFYTGFPSFTILEQCLHIIAPGENGENIIYVDSKPDSGTPNPKRTPKSRKLAIIDEFLLVLVRLRLGLFVEDLSQRFGISKSSVNRIFLSWINLMYLRFSQLCIWPTQESIKATMPESMRGKYPHLEWIIDAFEIQIERPSSLVLQSQSYSNYKSRNTLKGLLACTPSGQIGFISQLYTGNISDIELTIRSGFLKMPHNRGAMWLVDKGFQIQHLAEPLGVQVNMPAFVAGKSQMPEKDVFHTQQIASERIHIERAINKVKNFHIFDRCIPLSMSGTISQIWTVCAILTLFHPPIISA